MTDTKPPPPDINTKACDGCGVRVPIKQRRYDTGLCQGCQSTAVTVFGVTQEQAGIAVLVKKKRHHYNPFPQMGMPTPPMIDMVRRLVLAATGSLPLATEQEIKDAEVLREKFPSLVNTMKMPSL